VAGGVSEGNGKRRRDWILSPEPLAPRAEGRALVGVLALQGDFREHRVVLESLGADTREVRSAVDLQGLDGLIVPGGESTTMTKLMRATGLDEAIRAFAAGGGPVMGTCAGLITLARETVERDLATLGLIDIVVRRNAFGRQVHSFETELTVPELGRKPLHAVFIRGPRIEASGPGVRVLASIDGYGVAAEEGTVLVTAFHPEITDDTRLHRRFLEMVHRQRAARSDQATARQHAREGVVS
jgi:5'-phosphate synthase pdxT subunit